MGLSAQESVDVHVYRSNFSGDCYGLHVEISGSCCGNVGRTATVRHVLHVVAYLSAFVCTFEESLTWSSVLECGIFRPVVNNMRYCRVGGDICSVMYDESVVLLCKLVVTFVVYKILHRDVHFISAGSFLVFLESASMTN